MKKIYVLTLLSCLLMLSACDSYLDIKPVGSVIPKLLKSIALYWRVLI